MIYVFEVGVALARPPRPDRVSIVIVEAPDSITAELLACQIVCRSDVVMPVYSKRIEMTLDKRINQ